VNQYRYNGGFYADAQGEFFKKHLLTTLAGRYENYSDFGGNLSYNANARWDFSKSEDAKAKFVLRTSFSHGFRAPSLHQIYLSNVQTLVSNGTLSNQITFNNESKALNLLGVPKLKSEKGNNFSVGFTSDFILSKEVSLSVVLDGYYSLINDRIVFTGGLGDSDTSTVSLIDSLLAPNNATSLKFFTNGVNSQTLGVDANLRFKYRKDDKHSFILTLAGNYNKTQVSDLKTPEPLKNEGNILFDRKEKSRIESIRPLYKGIFNLDYFLGKWGVGIHNTLFGAVTWRYFKINEPLSVMESRDQTFSSKTLTDFIIKYNFSDKMNLSIEAYNIFNVYPDKIIPNGSAGTNLGGRTMYSREATQFNINGRYIFLKMGVVF
ncbi:MAG: TonB-dependent receptor plug domain-containing protein, partial [Bacteroidia bacterium]